MIGRQPAGAIPIFQAGGPSESNVEGTVIMKEKRTQRLKSWMASFAAGLLSVSAWAVDVTGGSALAPTDITALVLQNQDIRFTGGNYVVTLPSSGAGLVTPQSVDPTLIRYGNNGFSSDTNPTINYRGTISGDGALIVRSSFNSQRPAYGQPFTGGALIFSNQGGQSWGLVNTPSGGSHPAALIIESNATVAFFFSGTADASAGIRPWGQAFLAEATIGRNVRNDGYLYTSLRNTWGSITGTGVNVFQYNGGDQGALSGGSIYSGFFDFNSGLRVYRGASFVPQPDGRPTVQVSSDITVYQNGARQWLTIPSSFKVGDEVNRVPMNIYMFALNLQLWGSGIHQFTGVWLPPTGSKNHLELAPPLEAVKGLYHYGPGSNQAFGRVVNLTNRMTFLMGNGDEIVDNPDGATNNVFLQSNPFNSLLSTSNFEEQFNGDQTQAIAYNYSGKYRLNHNFNAVVDNNRGIVQRMRNSDWVNFILLDPKAWNPAATRPNHAVVTVPVFLGGLTRIDKNAILQLGDGTVGNDIARKVTQSNGTTLTSRYNDSMGNGMLITKGNDSLVPKGTGRENMNAQTVFQIVNNGKLIVNNAIGALSATVSDGTNPGVTQEVAAWMNANQLDGISGVGSVEQGGSLPLTLGSPRGNPNAYTGGTMIRAGTKVIAASDTALGKRDATGAGNVLNNGTLSAAGGIRAIKVGGNYSQVAAAANALANR